MADSGSKGGKRKRLGEILLEMGAIDPLQLQSALGHHQQWGVSLGRAVVEKRFCSEQDVLRALSLQTGLPLVDLDAEALDSRLIFNLPVKSAERLRAVPLRLEGKRHEVLVAAVSAPATLETLDALLAVSGKQRVVPLVALDEAIERAIGQLYYGRPRQEPQAPAPSQPLTPVSAPTGEAEFELSAEEEVPQAPAAQRPVPAPVPGPVLLYGWRDAAVRALEATLKLAGFPSRVLPDEALLKTSADDVIITSTLALQTFLGAGARAPGKAVVCGLPQDVDAGDARALGARMYLRPPFTAEQLRGAIEKCRKPAPSSAQGSRR